LKIAFKIEPSADKNVALNLITEVGDADISFLNFSKNPFKIEGFFSMNFEKNTLPDKYVDDVKKYINETACLQEINFTSSNIFYNFSKSSLIPKQYFIEDEKEQILDELFGQDKTRVCFQELCQQQAIKNIYSVPAVIHNSFFELYPSGKFTHSTSYQINNNKDSILHCIIYNLSIKIIFFKEGQLQIVQYFNYTTPADVCYHILNVAERFETTASSLTLSLSGMIDIDSTLYQELYKYFLHIKFAETTGVVFSKSFEELPTHFYHHLTALANAHN